MSRIIHDMTEMLAARDKHASKAVALTAKALSVQDKMAALRERLAALESEHGKLASKAREHREASDRVSRECSDCGAFLYLTDGSVNPRHATRDGCLYVVLNPDAVNDPFNAMTDDYRCQACHNVALNDPSRIRTARFIGRDGRPSEATT